MNARTILHLLRLGLVIIIIVAVTIIKNSKQQTENTQAAVTTQHAAI
ncbi:MAG: hypothetical protein ACO2ZZ_12765 [Cyclobacteriaceae bacterium]